MDKVKDMFKDKSLGFYITAVVALISLTTAIVYAISQSAGLNEALVPEDFSVAVLLLTLFAAILALALLAVSIVLEEFVKIDKVFTKPLAIAAPWVLFGFNLLALLLFAGKAYDTVSRLAPASDGLDALWGANIVPATIFIMLTIIGSIVSIFMPMFKPTPKAEETPEPEAKPAQAQEA